MRSELPIKDKWLEPDQDKFLLDTLRPPIEEFFETLKTINIQNIINDKEKEVHFLSENEEEEIFFSLKREAEEIVFCGGDIYSDLFIKGIESVAGMMFFEYSFGEGKNNGWKIEIDVAVKNSDNMMFAYMKNFSMPLDMLDEFSLYFKSRLVPYSEENHRKYLGFAVSGYHYFEWMESFLVIEPNWNVYDKLKGSRPCPFQEWFDSIENKVR